MLTRCGKQHEEIGSKGRGAKAFSKPRKRRILGSIVGFILSVFLVAVLLKISGYFLIAEKSMPRGLYRSTTSPTSYAVIHLPKIWSDLALQRNYVKRSWDRSRENRAIKHLIAGEGDDITISEAGITVNGEPVAYSKPQKIDSAGREMPPLTALETTLGEGEFLVLSHEAESGFDSRYYGILTAENLVSYAEPILIE